MSVKIHVGDCREVLKGLTAQSVHCVVTSPPYWGLRDYKISPVLWGGDAECKHIWGNLLPAHHPGQVAQTNINGRGHAENIAKAQKSNTGQFCQLCGCWRGNLGLEPTPELYVQHLVEVFREVWRVLRDDGILWLNLGSSYATNGGSRAYGSYDGETGRGPAVDGNRKAPARFKPKDLIPIPWMVALALQADGWYLRSAMPWVKKNCMPESVTDRPTTAHEYVFLLTKNRRYYYDGEAVKVGAVSAGRDDGTGHYRGNRHYKNAVDAARLTNKDNREAMNRVHQSRNRRTSDTFNESLDIRIEDQRAYLAHLEHVHDNGGMLLSESGDPVALLVNTASFKGAHFATFPPKLIEPMIRSGTSEQGCCPDCGTGWVRVIEKTEGENQEWAQDVNPTKKEEMLVKAGDRCGHGKLNRGSKSDYYANATRTTTVGWQPSCSCNTGNPIPCTILDPFVGSGTTLLVADRLGRDAIGIDLSGDYAEMARQRVAGDAPLFVDVMVVFDEVVEQ